MTKERGDLDRLVEEVAMLLEATVRVEEGIFHLTVPIVGDDGEGDEEDEEEEDEGGEEGDEEDEEAGDEEDEEDEDPALLVEIALSASEDGTTLFATRRLCAHDGSHDLEALLRAVAGTVHVQLSIDDDDDLVLGGTAPADADAEWVADMVGELAEFASHIAEDAAPVEEG